MALTDIIFDANNSAVASRGNIGVVSDSLSVSLSGFVSPTYFGGYWSVSATMKDAEETNLPNGTSVNAYHYLTHAKVGNGTISSGVVTIQVSCSDDVYLVVDPSALGLNSQTLCTTLITPS